MTAHTGRFLDGWVTTARAAIPRLVVLIACLGLALPLFGGFQSKETFLPAVGRVTGAGNPPAQIYTTVWISNLTAVPVTFTFQFLKSEQANMNPLSFQDSLRPGETKVYENIVGDKLGLSNALGAARIISSGEVFVSERIYNQPIGADLGNTEGLFFAGTPKDFSITPGNFASIQGVDQGGSENLRYNFTLIETGGTNTTVNVQVFDGDGTLLGQKMYTLLPYEQLQRNVLDIVPGIKTTNARITATVMGSSADIGTEALPPPPGGGQPTSSIIISGAGVPNESQSASGFDMSDPPSALASSGGTGVTSLNGLSGAVTLAHGANTTVNVNGHTITIDAVAGSGTGLTAVAHDNSLTGSGTVALPLGIANGQAVRSLNNLHDAVTLAAGTNVSITPSGNTLTIAATGGGGGVTSLNSLTGVLSLTAGSGISVTPSGSSIQITNTGGGGGGGLTLPFQGTASSSGSLFEVTNTTSGTAVEGVAQSGGQAVYGFGSSGATGVHGVSDTSYGVYATSGSSSAVYASSTSGTGVSGSSYSSDGVYGQTSSSSGAGSAIHGQKGSGSGIKLGNVAVWGDSDIVSAVVGSSKDGVGVFGASTNGYGIEGQTSSTDAIHGDSGSANGVSGSSSSSNGVYGFSSGSNGVYGSSSTGYGVYGTGFDGVHGETSQGGSGVAGIHNNNNVGVYGRSSANSNKAGSFDGGITVGNGSKSFVEPHPTDPTKQIRYVCLEGPESGTYFRGTGQVVKGFATIDVPEHFRIVSKLEGLTVQVTPVGEMAVLAVVSRSLDRIVVQGSKDVAFDYMVNGVRRSVPRVEPIEENWFYVPKSPNDPALTRPLGEETRSRLVANGILNPDASINLETAHRLGWDQQESWKRAEVAQGSLRR